MKTRTSTGTAFTILSMLAVCHMLNDMLQSIISAVYPLLKDSLLLNFTQIGLITLVFQMSSSIFQPVIGLITDKKPQPYSLPIGMTFTMVGILSLSLAGSFIHVLIAVFLTGLGSSVFHPEASRLAYMASGGKHGLAQSLFQVGGNFGSSIGPLLALWIITPYGQQNIGWMSLIALVCIGVMLVISKWYRANLYRLKPAVGENNAITDKKITYSSKKVAFAISILLILIFSKYVYMASLTSYYMFYLIDKFQLSVHDAQLFLFAFLFAVALGTIIGGPVGDRIGRKYVIWASILGTAPFALIMPHVGLVWTCIFSIFIGLILSSAFSAILVYAQELVPGKVGLIGGLFFGLAFGIAGIASAVLGKVADNTSIQYVYNICSYLPLLGLVAAFLPNTKKV
ncbi:FSR family fosmidomycin resistance protein-like MFS transporter [Dysgonomonas hofstadii]|uniref:FSR family fosmidomycin resistance protein-like MFS transporter n=1 Tax=Dysgonomonas hofstadii TaxID=637886 RepID=A0A840CDV6_9BACT|nr:MFS transporter [Dysgonomonas hofstadii]MBB4034120.1 FSR family fosmidomycin resistance protein-like MFS transporter [Dysgonomonas hofstadii]